MKNKTFSTVGYCPKRTRTSTRNFTKNLMNSTAIDLAFQSRARWSLKQKQDFINSCLIDMNISKFVLVDLKACLANAVEKEDKEYYQRWLDKTNEIVVNGKKIKVGVLYLNVDSNNRTTTIKEFKRNEIKIPAGDYLIADKGLTFTVKKNISDTYDTMDEDFREIFLSNTLSTHIITSATRSQLSDVFSRMNSGESLNIFENLNCSYSTTCEQIREITDELQEKFLNAKIFSETQINRRIIDGWFANVFYLYDKGINQSFSKSVHKNWYASDSISNKVVPYFVEDWRSFNDLVGKKIKLFPHRWLYFDLFYQIKEQKDLGKRFVDNKNIVQDFINMFTLLVADKTPKYFFPVVDEVTNKLKFSFDKNKTVLFPFSQLVKGEGGNTPTRFKAYEDAGWDITKYFTGELDKKRVLTRKEKQLVAVRDGWKDSDGEEFVPEELFDGEYDAGHILAHGNEGETTTENSVIEKMSKNRGKGLETTEIV